jgi:hypothetical protein
MALRIMMAKTEITTLWVIGISAPVLLVSLLLMPPSLFQDCDVPCPCVEGGNDGLHDCWLCCLIGCWEGFARVAVGIEVVVGGSQVESRYDRGIAEENRVARVVLNGRRVDVM